MVVQTLVRVQLPLLLRELPSGVPEKGVIEMAANSTRRTVRKTTVAKDAPSVIEGVVVETPAPAPVVRRRRPAVKVPAPEAVKAVVSDVAISKAAPTLLGIDGSLTRHTQEYTVDLLDKGEESERDFGKMLAKSPSETHQAFVAWVRKTMGEEIDARTVQILISTYHEFQRSPEQKAKMIEKRLNAAAARAMKAAAKKTVAAK